MRDPVGYNAGGGDVTERTVQAIKTSDGSRAPCLLRLSSHQSVAREPPVCEIEAVMGRRSWTRSAGDYFAALALIRRDLEAEGWLLSCYGASRNVYPSGMCRDMGAGLKAYRLRPGQQARPEDLVSILATGPDVEPATVEAQEAFFESWVGSAQHPGGRVAAIVAGRGGRSDRQATRDRWRPLPSRRASLAVLPRPCSTVGVLGWIHRWLGRSRVGATEGAPLPSRPASAPPAPPPPRDAPPTSAEPDDPFTPFAHALGVELPAPAPAPEEPEPDAEDVRLAERVLEHFRKNRPGPASAPSLSLRLLNLVASQHAEVGEMVRLVSADAALTAGVLTVANSAVYRGVDEIDTVRAAVVRLGLDEVARVAGAVSARSLFNPRLKAELATHGARFSALFHRALTVATGAAMLTLGRRDGRSDRAYLGGILFDVGKSVALRSLAALEGAAEGLAADPARVDRVLEQVHLEVGGECHQEWNLPRYLTVIAVRHHDREIPADPDFVDLHAVRLCGALLDLRLPALAHRAAREVPQSATALGLGPPAVRALDAELRRAAARAGTAFGIEGQAPL